MHRKHILTILFALGLIFGEINVAEAQCTALPYQLTNGQTADATQVMANFNALLACINGSVNTGSAGQLGYYATTGNTISGKSLSDLIDSAVGSTRGSILERGASGWALVPPGTSGNVLTSNGPGADPSYLSRHRWQSWTFQRSNVERHTEPSLIGAFDVAESGNSVRER